MSRPNRLRAVRGGDGHDQHVDDEIEQTIDQMEAAARGPRLYTETLLPDGATIVAAFLDVEVGHVAKNAPKWFARFRIVESAANPVHPEAVILRSYNAPRRGYLSPKHNLARDFLAVCRLPLRSLPPKAPPRAILGSFLADVFVNATTSIVKGYQDPRRREWVERPESGWYSVIASIDGIAAGSPSAPRFLSRRRRS